MIAPQELRIGNYLITASTRIFCIVRSIDDLSKEIHIDTIEDGNVFDTWDMEYQELEPVPISPEILDRAKFSYNFIVYSIGNFWLAPNDGWYDVYLHGLSSGISCRIKYLHQLQNLYFALTNQELQIKL